MKYKLLLSLFILLTSLLVILHYTEIYIYILMLRVNSPNGVKCTVRIQRFMFLAAINL